MWLSHTEEEEEDVYLLFLWERLDFFDFLLWESEAVDLEEEDVEDDLRLLLFLDLCLFLDWSLLELHPEREVC